MKKNVGALLCILALLLVTSCGKKSDYRAVIPADAVVVMGVDAQSMIEKSGISGEDIQAQMGVLKEILPQSLYEYAQKIASNPDELGLDYSSQIYVYTTPEKVGLVAKVGDERKVKALFEKLEVEGVVPALEKKEDNYCCELFGQAVAVFNKSVFLLLTDIGYSDSLIDEALSMMKQKDKNFMTENKLFNDFDALKGDITCLTSYEGLLPDEYRKTMREAMPKGVRLSDLNVLFGIDFEMGKVVVDAHSVCLGDEAKVLSEIGLDAVAPLSGKSLPQNDPVMWFGCGLNGEKFFDLLKEYPHITSQLGLMTPLLKNLLPSIDGDLTVSVSSADMNEASLYVELKKGSEEEFLSTITDMLDLFMMPVTSVGENAYKLTLPMAELTFGLDAGNVFYLILIGEKPDSAGKNTTAWAKEVKGKTTYARINVGAMYQMMAPFMTVENARVLGMLDYARLSASEANEANLEVVFVNKNENALKQLVAIIVMLNE